MCTSGGECRGDRSGRPVQHTSNITSSCTSNSINLHTLLPFILHLGDIGPSMDCTGRPDRSPLQRISCRMEALSIEINTLHLQFRNGCFGNGCFGSRKKRKKDMRFFDRTEEIASLREIREMSKDNAQFTVVTGRRRIGKTSLIWQAYGTRLFSIFSSLARLKAIYAKTTGLRLKTSWGFRRWDGWNVSSMSLNF